MPAGGKDDRLGLEGVQFAGCQFNSNNACSFSVDDKKVKDLIFIEEIDFVLQALLVKRLKNHVTRAVGGMTGTLDRFAGHVIGVAAEVALQDAPFGGAVKRQAHVFKFQHRINGFVAHKLDGILIAEVIRTFDRVVGVPFGMVLFGVAESRADAALGGPSMRTRGI